MAIVKTQEGGLIVEISADAQKIFEDLYADFPNIDERDMQLVEDTLYALSHGQSFRIDTCERQLVLTPIKRKSLPWDK